MKKYRDRIRISANIRSGKPCIVNTWIAVSDVFDYLGGGMTVDEVLDDFPDLILADIKACLAFAADRDRRLTVVPTAIAPSSPIKPDRLFPPSNSDRLLILVIVD
jgi:uncharacterized protein (DUF433 family)